MTIRGPIVRLTESVPLSEMLPPEMDGRPAPQSVRKQRAIRDGDGFSEFDKEVLAILDDENLTDAAKLANIRAMIEDHADPNLDLKVTESLVRRRFGEYEAKSLTLFAKPAAAKRGETVPLVERERQQNLANLGIQVY